VDGCKPLVTGVSAAAERRRALLAAGVVVEFEAGALYTRSHFGST
jgi:hypothetical protein